MKLLKVGKDVNFYIFNLEAKKVAGLKLIKFNILNNYEDCSTICDEGRVLKDLNDKKILKIHLKGVYINTPEFKKFRDSAMLGDELKCRIGIDSDYHVFGQFVTSDFEIETIKSDLIFYTFTLLNSGKFNLIKV
jgi:hypothetical protein